MSLAAYETYGAKTEQEADYDVAAAFAQFGDPEPQQSAQILAEPVLDWEPIRAEDLWRLATAPETAPANEHLPAPRRAFPPLKARGPRLDAALMSRAIVVADWLVVLAAAQIAALWGYGLGLAALPAANAIAVVFCALTLKAGLWATGVYRTGPARLGAEHALGGLALGAIGGLAVAAFAAPDARSAAALAATIPAAAIVLAAVHALYALAMHAAWKRQRFAETAVIVGATDAAARFIARATKEGALDVVAVVEDRADRAPALLSGAPVVGGVDDLLAWEHLPKIDRIVICVSHVADARVRTLIEKLRAAPNRVDLLFDFEVAETRGRRIQHVAGAALAIVSGRSTSPARALVKRAQDLILGGLLSLAIAPALATIAVAVRLDSQGPALFKQRRYGLNNRIITIWKFRTMTEAACREDMRQVCAGDQRITRIGRFLRATSLDELPQLFNVLKGDMSLVGPRPHAVDMRASDQAMHAIVADYAHRHRVKPGITGWAQVNGSRGPIETPDAVKKRVRLDLDYIAKASLWLDLWILTRTLPALFGDRKNVR